MTSLKETTIRCACGQVEFRFVGKPILTTVCHCDDCQRASAELEKLPHAPKTLDVAGGTAYVMYRRDRIVCAKGHPLLQDRRTEGEPFTKRVIASCCHSPLYLDFEKGHWLSVFRDRFGDQAPRVQMRTQTRYVPAEVEIPNDAPHFRTYSLGFMARLIGSKIAMDLSHRSKKGDPDHDNPPARA